MKIAVIGHYCVDVFLHSDGTEERRHGGIYHSVAALANLASDRDTIIPIFGVAEKDFDGVISALSVFKNVSAEGLFRFPGSSNEVHYYSADSAERSLNISAPISFAHIKKFLNVDGVYVNMISGKDITVDTIDEIRLEVRGKKVPIHLDLHCLTLTVKEDGTRERKPMPDWRRWCFMTDSVQVNEEEASGISVEHFNDELLAKQMIPLMVKAFIITRGGKNGTLYQEEHKHLITTEIATEQNQNPLSVVGAGDIFGVSFLYAYMKKKDYSEAAKFAQMSATFSTKFPPLEKHARLKEMKERL